MVHLNYNFSSRPPVVRCLGSLGDLALLHIDSKFCGYLKVLQLCHLEIFSASVNVFQVCRLLCFYPVELLQISLKSILLTWFLRCVIKHYKLLQPYPVLALEACISQTSGLLTEELIFIDYCFRQRQSYCYEMVTYNFQNHRQCYFWRDRSVDITNSSKRLSSLFPNLFGLALQLLTFRGKKTFPKMTLT